MPCFVWGRLSPLAGLMTGMLPARGVLCSLQCVHVGNMGCLLIAVFDKLVAVVAAACVRLRSSCCYTGLPERDAVLHMIYVFCMDTKGRDGSTSDTPGSKPMHRQCPLVASQNLTLQPHVQHPDGNNSALSNLQHSYTCNLSSYAQRRGCCSLSHESEAEYDQRCIG